jgi:hypothetical protein
MSGIYLVEYVGKYMPPKLDDCIALRRYIYIGQPPENPRRGVVHKG